MHYACAALAGEEGEKARAIGLFQSMCMSNSKRLLGKKGSIWDAMLVGDQELEGPLLAPA